MQSQRFRPTFIAASLRYDCRMHDNNIPPELERYLALCKRIYERMERDGTWPWLDSTESQDLVDSKGNPSDV